MTGRSNLEILHADPGNSGEMKTGASKIAKHSAQRLAATMLPIELQGREFLLEAFGYQDDSENEELLVLVHRDEALVESAIPLVRVHSGCVTGDIFHSLRCDCCQQLQMALKVVCAAPFGALVYVPYHEGRGIGLFKKLQAYALQDQGMDTVDANIEIGVPVEARDYSSAAHALLELGMQTIWLLSNNPAKHQALSDLGISIAGRIPLRIEPNSYNRRYLETKRVRMAHEF
jgi:GTP cyclohydrolase II/3,4-dihydroxy 2-butanone 4-phosphate synthase/GTP cyclohydrolase II